MSNPYDFVQAPNIAGAGNYAQMLFNALNPNQQRNGQQQQNGQRPTQGNQSYLAQLMNMFNGNSPNRFAPGGQFSPFDSYINSSGDLMSGGQVTPG